MKTNNQLYFMFFLVLFVAVMTWKPIVPKDDLDVIIEAKLSEGLVGMQSQVNTLETANSALQTKVNTLETASSALQTKVETLETANTTLQASINTLETASSALQTSINTLETANSALQTKVGTLETSNSTLKTLLSGVSRLRVGEYDTLRFSGMNLQIVNGKDSTETSNGLGNLIVGYNEQRTSGNIRNGSHYVVIGAMHNYSAYGGIVSGSNHTASGKYSSVSGGTSNTASGGYSSVSGGAGNRASGNFSSVSGGRNNTASGDYSSILGGYSRTVNTQLGIYPQ